MTGAGVSHELRRKIFEHFGGCCAYCRSPLYLLPGSEHIEHIIPRAAQGLTVEENLCLCCPRCNSRKGIHTKAIDPITGKRVPLFHPRQQRWGDHFRWTPRLLRIVGRTATGRATIHFLRLNDSRFLRARQLWRRTGWSPVSA